MRMYAVACPNIGASGNVLTLLVGQLMWLLVQTHIAHHIELMTMPTSTSHSCCTMRLPALSTTLMMLSLSPTCPGARKRKGLALVSVTGGLLGLYVCVYCSYLLARLPQGSW